MLLKILIADTRVILVVEALIKAIKTLLIVKGAGVDGALRPGVIGKEV